MKNKKTGINLLSASYFLFSIVLLTMAFTAFHVRFSFAATYYLSGSGNDSFSGTAPDSAWKTISKLNTVTLLPGDSILFHTGDVFRGQMDLNVSGTNGQSIYFGAYGNLKHPIISGAEPINGWTKYSGNIYSATVSKPVLNLFANSRMMTSARYPNSGFLTIDSSGVDTGLHDATLNQPDHYWEGAILKVRSTDNKYEQTEIDSFKEGWLKFVTPVHHPLQSGYGYYLDHSFQALDTLNEWYYDTAQKKIYFYSVTDPNTLVMEGSVYDYGVNAFHNNSFLKFEGIDFEKQAKDGAVFTGTSANILFEDCVFKQCMSRGINYHASANDTINQCSFLSISGQAFKADELSRSVISNSEMKKTGAIPGYGLQEAGEWNAIHISNGNECTVIANHIDSTGYIGILISGKNNLMEKNRIENCVMNLNQGAAVFIYNSDSSNTILKDNFIFNTYGNSEATPGNPTVANGVTVNGLCSFIGFYHNTIVNSRTYGININSGNQNDTLKENVIYNSGQAQVYLAETDTIRRTKENVTDDNIFYCLNDIQKPLLLDGRHASFHAGIFNANYYCNPYDYYPVYRFDLDSVTEFIPVLFSKWKTANGDLNAQKSLVTWQTHAVTDTIGADWITNGDFTNNFDGWETSDFPNCEMLLDNYTILDNGCVKLIMTADTPNIWGQIRTKTAFEFSGNELYQLGFSTKSLKNLNVKTFIQSKITPYQSLTRHKFFPVDTSRSDFNYVFASMDGSSEARVVFEIVFPDSVIWIDNVHLFKVSAVRNDSSRLSRLLTNYSAVTKNVSLGDSAYRDLDGNLVKGSYTLPPYSSYVLTLDSPLFVSGAIPEPAQKHMALFPNPLNPAIHLLHYSFGTFSQNEQLQFQLFDVMGRRIMNEKLDNNTGVISVPAVTPSGIYLVKVFNARNSFEKKLILIH